MRIPDRSHGDNVANRGDSYISYGPVSYLAVSTTGDSHS